MITFGDADPEDAYDASDPIPTRLFIIGEIIDALEHEFDLARRTRRRADVVRLLAALTAEVVADGD